MSVCRVHVQRTEVFSRRGKTVLYAATYTKLIFCHPVVQLSISVTETSYTFSYQKNDKIVLK